MTVFSNASDDSSPRQSSPRPHVLLITNLTCWVMGIIAQEIMRWLRGHFNFRMVSMDFLLDFPHYFDSVMGWAEIVHCFLDLQHIRPEVYELLTRKAFVGMVHHIEPQEEPRLREIAARWQAPDAIVLSCGQVKNAVCQIGFEEKQLFIVPHGVDIVRFRPPNQAERAAARNALRIPPGCFALGFFGDVRELRGRKGADVLLESLKMLRTLGRKIFLVTTGPKPPEFQAELSCIGIPFHWDPFLLSHYEIIRRYWALDAYIVTSRQEGGPIPLIEAMSCGLPTVSTPIGMAADYLKDGENGLLIPLENPSETAKGILRLMDSPSLALRLGRAARRTVCEKLLWRHVLRSMKDIYEFALHRSLSRGHSRGRDDWTGPRFSRVAASDHYKVGLRMLNTREFAVARRIALHNLCRWPLERCSWWLFCDVLRRYL